MKCWRIAKRSNLRHPALPFPILAFSLATFVAVTTQPAFSQETIRTQSNIVLVPALVKNTRGEIVYGLQAKGFVVEDDGVLQTPTLDESPETQPLSLVIAVQRGKRELRISTNSPAQLNARSACAGADADRAG
jgi:hypothetical protein